MIKLLAFDLDGTLLTEDHRIDEETLKEIKKHDKIKYIIATGRNYALVEDIIDTYELDCDLILNNGHEFLSKDKEEHITYAFSDDKLRRICKILIKYNFHSSLTSANGNKYTFTEIEEYYNEHLRMSSVVRKKDISELITSTLFTREAYLKNTITLSGIEELDSLEILKIDAKNLDKEANEKAMQELAEIGGISLSTSYEAYVEICDSRMNKGKLLLQIADKYGIEADEIAAFGDSDNDIELLNVVPHSFAMKNGKDALKKVARYITDTNDNQGVLKGIRKILKEQGNV